MKAKKSILMVIPARSSFIKSDIEIVSTQYPLIINEYNWNKKHLVPLLLGKQLFTTFKYLSKINLIVIQFGGYWALIPSFLGKIFNIPVAIINHGTDCAKMPSINYGSLRKKHLKVICHISYNLATILLPVSTSLVYCKNDYNSKDAFQGLKYHFPRLKTPIKIINNGLDVNFWKPLADITKENNRFIAVFSQSQFILKGGDLIINIAKKNPLINFYIAGTETFNRIAEIPNNVFFLGRISKEELRVEYCKSQFHLQLSMFEGFGLALCEAMLCECIPIGSSVNNIPEIIGEAGFILHSKNINNLNSIINRAIQLTNKRDMGKKARKRIIEKYNINKRTKELLETLESI